MRRLLAEVLTKDLKRRYRAGNGMEYAECRVRARVLGSGVDALDVPARVVGKELTVRRDCLLPWVPRRGDLMILGSAESARVLCPRRAGAGLELAVEPGVVFDSLDLDRDGFKEDVLANRFVAAAIQPHRGARLWSLESASGADCFGHTEEYAMAGKYILLGGVELVIREAGSPGEIWKSAFERDLSPGRVESVMGTGGLGYSRNLKDPGSVRVEKMVHLDPELPLVTERYVLRHLRRPVGDDRGGERDGAAAGAGKKGGDSDQDEGKKELTAAIRMSTAVHGPEPSLNLFEIPCADGVHRVRFHRPSFGRRWRWRDWRDEHFALRGGFLVSRCENREPALVALFNERRAVHVSVRSDYTGPEVSIVHRTRKLARGRSLTLGAGYVCGDAVAVGSRSALVGTLGRARGRTLPLAITLRSSRDAEWYRASISTTAGRKTVTLRRRELPELGHVYGGTVEIERASLPVTVGVGSGAERLELLLEG